MKFGGGCVVDPLLILKYRIVFVPHFSFFFIPLYTPLHPFTPLYTPLGDFKTFGRSGQHRQQNKTPAVAAEIFLFAVSQAGRLHK